MLGSREISLHELAVLIGNLDGPLNELHLGRAEGFVFGHVADEGWIDASAGPLLR